ncbi:hypothetical protein JCM11641_001096 [Rhodosporidiobolus odoratus]
MLYLAQLPPEILQMIVDELDKATWDPQDKQAEGRNLALVCKALSPFGSSLIYRELSLRGLEHNKLFQRVLSNADLPALVSSLTFTDSRAVPSPDRLALLERLLPICTSLTQLHVYSSPLTINRLFGERGQLLPITLAALTIRSMPFLEAVAIGPVLSSLAHLSSLRHLDLLVSIPVHPPVHAPRLSSVLAIPLRSLSLAFPPSNSHNRYTEYCIFSYLTSLFDPSTLLSAELRLAAAEPFLFTWLSSLSSLRDLRLHLHHDTVDAHLSSFTITLPLLVSLQNLLLRQRVLRVPRPNHASPDALASFLASLPLPLETVNTSLFFPSGVSQAPLADFLRASVGVAPGEGEPGGKTGLKRKLRRFTCEVKDEEEEGGRACEMIRVQVEQDGGREGWEETNGLSRCPPLECPVSAASAALDPIDPDAIEETVAKPVAVEAPISAFDCDDIRLDPVPLTAATAVEAGFSTPTSDCFCSAIHAHMRSSNQAS